jgi:DNA replication and repair protein RecF
VEHETAELAIAVAAARCDTVARLSRALAQSHDNEASFPIAAIALDGWIEAALASEPATEVEDRYRAVLKSNRGRDAAAGRTLDGPHLTDLRVTHAAKGVAAADSSTGEQKALLIRLVLAHAGLIGDMSGFSPVLLLDEVIAHLDPTRRRALYDWLEQLNAQVWMTGADPAAFADIAGRSEVFEISPGRATRAA